MLNIFLRIAVVFSIVACLPAVSSGEISHEAKALVRGNTEFALELYSELRKEKGNIFFSPYSISSAMGMVYAGARGNTEKQMAKALRFSLNQQLLHPAFAELDAELKKLQRDNIMLSIANSLWPQQDYKFSDDYLSLTKKFYEASVTPLDYRSAPDAAVRQINKWVSEKTEKKINDIVESRMFDKLTRLVLVNAIYFKGRWERSFERYDTQQSLFHLSASEAVQVPMMNQKNRFKYIADEVEHLQILELFYIGRDFSMIMLLPNETEGLEKIEKRLSFEKLDNWKERLAYNYTEVSVSIPRFSMKYAFGSDSALKKLGMTDAFDMNKADFSGMDGKRKWLYISAAVHKAYVDVNEEGTEAAAATAGGIHVRSAPPTFQADHPFLFLIQDNHTGNILFMGRVSDPSKSGE